MGGRILNMNIKSKLLIPRILFYWLVLGIGVTLAIIPWIMEEMLKRTFGKIVDKIDPRYLPGITPKQTRNKIVRLYARKEGIQSIKIDDQKYYFNKRVK